MLLSMTGFGASVAVGRNKKFTVEVKSLNSKQLDLNTRIPASLRGLEAEMRAMAAPVLERGKADLAVNVDTTGSEDAPAIINATAVSAYVRQISTLCEENGIPYPADIWAVLSRLPEIYSTDAVRTLTDEDAAAVLSALREALEALTAHRRAEGLKLEAFFAERIANITALLAEVPKYETARVAKVRERLVDALEKLPAVEYDKGRLEQELIFYIEKLDINEEKQRLAQHLTYFTETVNSPTPGQGKKLGFIAQEMGREINTLGSKSNDADMQRLVVQMKDNLEQIKEQVLNVL